MEGYISISRRLFDNPLWKEARVFSRVEAWLDLIQLARFDNSNENHNERDLTVQRGEVPASRRFLEKRWSWGSTKVNSFLKLLRINQMITTKQTNGQTIITLCNYDSYNKQRTTNQTTKREKTKPMANHHTPKNKPKINNVEINKKETTDVVSKKDGVAVTTPSSKYLSFISFCEINAPEVLKMERPITEGELTTLLKLYGEREIANVVLAMANKPGLTKKYTSGYLTARKWLEIDKKNKPTEMQAKVNACEQAQEILNKIL